MNKAVPRPGLDMMRRVEALLREELAARGEDVSALAPHEISRHMRCGVQANGALHYAWKGEPLLDVEPEHKPDGTVSWRFFTRETPVQ